MKLEIPKHIMFKLRAWRDLGGTEVTGFFVSDKENMSKIIDAIIIKAKCSAASVDISAESIEKFYLDMANKEIYPDQLKIWWHTHPGNSASPSGVDDTTFQELGKDRTSNIMYILAKGGNEYAKVSVTDIASGIMLSSEIKVEHPLIPWSEFPSYEKIKKDYADNVEKEIYSYVTTPYEYGGYGGYSRYNGYNNRTVYDPKKNEKEGKEKEEKEEREDALKKADKEITEKLFELTADELDYIESLHVLVEDGGITADDANALAVQEGHGYNFYTTVYGEFSDDSMIVGAEDIETAFIENLWDEAKNFSAFLETLRVLIDSKKIEQETANLYLADNKFDVCYIDGKYVRIQ